MMPDRSPLKKLLPTSFFGRGLLIVVLPMLAVQLISIHIFFDRHWDSISRHMASTLAGEIAFTSYLMTGSSPKERETVEVLLESYTNLQVDFLTGTTLPPDTVMGEFQEFRDALKRRIDMPFSLGSTEDEIFVYVALTDYVLAFKTSKKRLVSGTTTIYIIWAMGASIFFLCIALLFLRNQVRPIRELAEASERFGRGLEHEHFKPAGASEVRRAARAFLVMRERIRRQVSGRTEMLAGISHDLRTPLTRMKLQLAMLPETPEMEGLRRDLAQMEHMVGEYLDFAKGAGGEETEKMSLISMLGEVIEDYQRQNKTILLDAPHNVDIEIRPEAFRRMLHNLIDNALRYGSECQVSLRLMAARVDIMVDDNGPGIAPNQYEEAFKPFTRLDPSRNINTGGSGLGLTIARDIAQRHGGDIVLETSPLGGLRAIVRMPLQGRA